MHRRRQVLAKTPALGRAVVIDHAHLVVPESIDTVFSEKEFGVLNQEVANLRLGKVEHKTAGMAYIGEVQ
jgi:hypothetical protein